MLCDSKKRLTIQDLTAVLTHFYSPKSEEFDSDWTLNAFAHIVWKLNSHQFLHPQRDLMSLENILYHLAKRYRREFIEGKRSFFQRVVQKDEGPGSHFVGFVSGINRMTSHTELLVSDGYY